MKKQLVKHELRLMGVAIFSAFFVGVCALDIGEILFSYGLDGIHRRCDSIRNVWFVCCWSEIRRASR